MPVVVCTTSSTERCFEVRQLLGDLGEMVGLRPVAPVLLEGLWSGVRLQHNGLQGQRLDDFLQFRETEQRLRQRDAESQFYGPPRRGLISLKVVHHAADGVCALLPEGLKHFRVRLTGVKDDGLAEFQGQANLGAEGLELNLLAGGGGEEVQADLC